MLNLLNQNVVLLCLNYIYAGKLVEVDADHVVLEDAKLVYETGPWGEKTWSDAQALPAARWQVSRAAIESFGLSGR
jgi:hypothetical protein